MLRHVVVLTGFLTVAAALIGCSNGEESVASPAQSGQSYSSAADSVFQCVTDKGWGAKISWDGTITASSEIIPRAQYSSYQEDLNECWKVVDDRILTMSPAEIANAYAAELKTRDCLITLGYTVDQPPSEQTYADSFFGERWTAYGASTFVQSPPSDEDWERVGKTCVQPSWAFGAE